MQLQANTVYTTRIYTNNSYSANNDYNRLYRQIGSLNRQKLSMQFMGDPL